MIAANGVDRALPRAAAASRRCAACCARPQRWDRIVALAAAHGETPAGRRPTPRALDALPRPAAPGGSRRASPDLSLSVVKLLGSGEYARRAPGRAARPATSGSRCSDYTHSTAPNRRFPDLVTQRLLKAALAGAAAALRRRASWRALARHCTRAGGQRRTRSSGRCASRRRRCCCSRASASASTRIVTGASEQGHLGAHRRARRSRARVVRGFEGLDVGDRVRVELVAHRRRARLHRLPARRPAEQDSPSLAAAAPTSIEQSMATGFMLFPTSIGPCGIAWGDARPASRVQLPEAQPEQTRSRGCARRFAGAAEAGAAAGGAARDRRDRRAAGGRAARPARRSSSTWPACPTSTAASTTSPAASRPGRTAHLRRDRAAAGRPGRGTRRRAGAGPQPVSRSSCPATACWRPAASRAASRRTAALATKLRMLAIEGAQLDAVAPGLFDA